MSDHYPGDGCACDDGPCGYCGNPACLGDCWDEEYDDGVPMPAVETIDAGGLL
jgi:hypothetical protein